MKNRIPPHIEKYRIDLPGYHYSLEEPKERNGAFLIPHNGRKFKVIVSNSGGWDHVSISHPSRCPSWNEMSFFKNLFFEEHEAVIQIHPPEQFYVNYHPNCLHLWRNQKNNQQLPPSWMVGPLKMVQMKVK